MLKKFAITLLLALLSPLLWAEDVYMTAEEFLANNFPEGKPELQTVWINKAQKQEISTFMYRDFRNLRVRYWQQNQRTAWIFDEIGKERPITIGLILNNDSVETVKVLAFRESRGWEVKHDFFTDQFRGIKLTDKNRLNQHIDGITGATLSVRAVKRATTLALYLQQLSSAE